MMRNLLIILAFVLTGQVAQAGADSDPGYVLYPYDGTFEEAASSVENAIVGAGLVIDYVSNSGEMLERTKADVGSDVTIYDDAKIYLFCSARLSRKVLEADPTNIAWCPYSIFVYDRAGQVQIGYHRYPAGIMQEVEALLDSIVQEAVAF